MPSAISDTCPLCPCTHVGARFLGTLRSLGSPLGSSLHALSVTLVARTIDRARRIRQRGSIVIRCTIIVPCMCLRGLSRNMQRFFLVHFFGNQCDNGAGHVLAMCSIIGAITACFHHNGIAEVQGAYLTILISAPSTNSRLHHDLTCLGGSLDTHVPYHVFQKVA